MSSCFLLLTLIDLAAKRGYLMMAGNQEIKLRLNLIL